MPSPASTKPSTIRQEQRYFVAEWRSAGYFYVQVRKLMNNSVPYRWTRAVTKKDLTLLQWPPRSPYPTNMIFFFCGLCERYSVRTSITKRFG